MDTRVGDQLFRQISGGHSPDELPTTVQGAVLAMLGLHVSQERLAVQMGIPRRTLRRWASGEVKNPKNAKAPALVAGARLAILRSWSEPRRMDWEDPNRAVNISGTRIERGRASHRVIRLSPGQQVDPGAAAAVLAAYDADQSPAGIALALAGKLAGDARPFYGGYILAGRVDSPPEDDWEDLAYEDYDYPDEDAYGFVAG